MTTFFAPFTKVDAVQRRVYGSLTEDVDRSGEIFDYTSSVPEFRKWSGEMAKATGGENLGNIRAMHQLVAAGKLVEITFDDMAKRIDLVAEITDDAEWQKCLDRTYTGFSPGGKFLRKWADPDRPMYKRYTGQPNHVAIVDLPCNPGASFTMVKADGAEEVMALGAGDELALAKAALADCGGVAEYRAVVTAMDADCVGAIFPQDAVGGGNGMAKHAFSADERKKAAESGTALPDGSFPIEDKEDLEDAVQAYGRAKDKDAAKAHITKRAKALAATDLLPADWAGSTRKEKIAAAGDMNKGMGEVADMAQLILSLQWLAASVTAESAQEADGSPLPGLIRDWLESGLSILGKMCAEESEEVLKGLATAVAALPLPMALAADAGDMAKRGARHSKADLDRLQAIHDHSVGMGASCSGRSEKIAESGDMAKLAFDLASTRDDMAKLAGENDEMRKRIEAFERQPAPPRGRLLAVGKGDDVAPPEGGDAMAKIADLPEQQQAGALIKLALRQGRPFQG